MGCSCGCNQDPCRSISLLKGDKGDTGTAGRDGNIGDNSDIFQFNTSTVGDPGTGFLGFNNANVSAATSINISQTDKAGVHISGWLGFISIANTTTKGYIRVSKRFDDTKFVFFAITGNTGIGSGFDSLTVTYITSSSNSPFALNDDVVFSFTTSGDDGIGVNGIIVNQSDLVQHSSGAATATTTLASYTLAGNTLVNNGDQAIIEVVVQNKDLNVNVFNANPYNVRYSYIDISGASGISQVNLGRRYSFNNPSGTSEQVQKMRVVITKSGTDAIITTSTSLDYGSVFETAAINSAVDFTLNTTIDIKLTSLVNAAVTDLVYQRSFYIYKINA